ncbi:hypothetical protein GF367_02385 [Candidatus Woesearchaeota archaeon]|nr:hypothetical protein [Candidatus Woesearchaeota archaeon]
MRHPVAQPCLFLIVLVLCSSSVMALGVVPSSQERVFEPGQTHTYQLKILNNEGAQKTVNLYVIGDLAPFLSLDRDALSFSSGQREAFVTVTLRQPRSASVQGRVEGKVVVQEHSRAGGQIAASLSVVSRFTLVVPYAGTYAEAKLFVGDFDRGKQGNFIIEVRNLGEEDIAEAQAYFKVLNMGTYETVATLTSEPRRIPKEESAFFTVPWRPDVPRGSYRVVATVAYDGETVEAEESFAIGQRSVAIDAITVNEFSLGGIAKFNILLRNEWSGALSGVYAEVTITQGDERYAFSTTQTVDLPGSGSRLVNAYWDTGNVVPGAYDMEVVVYYSGEQVQKSFDIVVKQDSIETGFTGQVVGGGRDGEQEPISPVSLLVVLVVIVLVVNVILFRKLLRKKS